MANPSRLFILRPVATALLTAAILLAGGVAYLLLPVSALPQVDYPTIQIVTFYPGASPDVMASSVTTPLERQFGQLPGLKQMTSTSSFGASLITLQFIIEYQIDVAEQQVQAAINAAATFLPRDLPNPPVYSKVNPADTPVLTLALTSDTLPLPRVEDLADTNLAQKISQLPGVGLVSISGGQRPAVRVQADPSALASYGLGLEDLRSVLGQANVDQAKGNLEGPRQSFTIGANDQIFSAAEYQAVVVTYRNGAPVRLADVATVIDGVENTKQAAWMNDKPAVIVNIQRQPGANIIGVVDRIKRLLPQLKASLPSSVEITTLTDRTATIRASVHDVEFTLVLTIALVVMVMFLFLRSLAATVIPSVPVPISIVGTFGVMYLLGYSLDNLSLMALTISTGFVVDDAIVMIENIARYIEAGQSPLPVALKGSFPIQDTGVILGISEAPPTVSFMAMAERQQALARVILKDPDVASLSSFIGVDGVNMTPNSGRIQINLKPRDERAADASDIIRRLQPQLEVVDGITLYMQPVQDLTVEDRVSRTQYQYSLEDADAREPAEIAPRMIERLKTLPQLRDVASDQQSGGLQAALVIG